MNNHHTQLTEIFKHNQVVEEHPYLRFKQNVYPSVYRHTASPYFYEQQIFQELQRTAIVEDYFPRLIQEDLNMEIQEVDTEMRAQQPYQELAPHQKTCYALKSLNFLDSQSSGRQLPSRNSSVSSFTSESQLSSDQPTQQQAKPNLMEAQRPHTHLKARLQIQNQKNMPKKRREVGSSTQKRQRLNKIKKVQQVGCNCKKSKCLKMYCECFNLQILCGQNCNCVGCGNMAENQSHQKAVLDALTRNPKAFAQDSPVVDSAFQLGIELSEVRKGCKCRKTQCKKKYCECYNSGMSCGIFCLCQQCENKNYIK